MHASSAQSVISGVHGRERRLERNIPKSEAKHARRHGMKESAGNGLFKYTYKGYVFVIHPSTNKEVTSYLSNDWASPFSGTRKTEPVFVKMQATPRMKRNVANPCRTIRDWQTRCGSSIRQSRAARRFGTSH